MGLPFAVYADLQHYFQFGSNAVEAPEVLEHKGVQVAPCNDYNIEYSSVFVEELREAIAAGDMIRDAEDHQPWCTPRYFKILSSMRYRAPSELDVDAAHRHLNWSTHARDACSSSSSNVALISALLLTVVSILFNN